MGIEDITSSWEAGWGETRRIDLLFAAGTVKSTETIFFEFKIGDTDASYKADLDKLAGMPPTGAHLRGFFCALVDEFAPRTNSSDRIRAVLEWTSNDGSLRAEPVVPQEAFTRFTTKSPKYVTDVQCIVALFEILPFNRLAI